MRKCAKSPEETLVYLFMSYIIYIYIYKLYILIDNIVISFHEFFTAAELFIPKLSFNSNNSITVFWQRSETKPLLYLSGPRVKVPCIIMLHVSSHHKQSPL